jgi:hypothetical protein
VTEIEQEVRSTSDNLLRSLERLEALEAKKRTTEPDSAEFRSLAAEIERLGAAVFAHAHAQRELGDKSRAIAKRSGADVPTIEETVPNRDLSMILAEWRAAERRMVGLQPDGAEYAAAKADVDRLRSEYHDAYSATYGPGESRKP